MRISSLNINDGIKIYVGTSSLVFGRWTFAILTNNARFFSSVCLNIKSRAGKIALSRAACCVI